MPSSVLPEMTLRSPATVPPIVVAAGRPDDADAGIVVGERAGAGRVGADEIPSHDVTGRGSCDLDAVAVVPGDQVAGDDVGVRAARQADPVERVATIEGPGPVGADVVPLDDVARALDQHADLVAGDDVARLRRRPADRVVAADQVDAVDADVGDPGGAGRVRSDEVAEDTVTVALCCSIRISSTLLPEMTLRSAGASPPIVLLSLRMTMPLALPVAPPALPAVSVPIQLPRTVLPSLPTSIGIAAGAEVVDQQAAVMTLPPLPAAERQAQAVRQRCCRSAR